MAIDDALGSLENASDDQPTKALLASRKWLSRSHGDANFKEIVLDVTTGFNRLRRETRVIAAIIATIALLSIITVTAVYLEVARRQALIAKQIEARSEERRVGKECC